MEFKMKALLLSVSYLGVFLLGAFSASQFKFNKPVEFDVWMGVVFITFAFIVLYILNSMDKRR